MGLNVSHGAFDGAYSAFNRFRTIVCNGIGGKWPGSFGADDIGFWYAPDGFSQDTHPGLWEFLCHSDCDGEISPEMCWLVADDLEALAPMFSRYAAENGIENVCRGRTIEQVTQQFIDGCRRAAQLNETLRFC